MISFLQPSIYNAKFAHLEKLSAVPTCEQVKGSTERSGRLDLEGAFVHWRLLDGQMKVARVVVADDLEKVV